MPYGPVSAGALTLIGSSTPNGGTFDFTSIPASYKVLKVVYLARGDTAATSTNLWVRFNGDSGNNYDYERSLATATTVSCDQGQAVAQVICGDVVAANGPANSADSGEITIPNYAGTTFQKSLVAISGAKNGTGAGNTFTRFASGWWRSTVAINEVTVLPAAGNFVVGSVAYLYGLS